MSETAKEEGGEPITIRVKDQVTALNSAAIGGI